MPARPIAENLFVGQGDAARLIAGRRKTDGEIVFPLPSGPERELFDQVELPPEGTLWAFTVQRFRPKPPYAGPGDNSDFEPYAVGYVELPGSIVVETRIEAQAPFALALKQPMRLTTQVFRTDSDGSEVLTYAFRPLA